MENPAQVRTYRFSVMTVHFDFWDDRHPTPVYKGVAVLNPFKDLHKTESESCFLPSRTERCLFSANNLLPASQ